MHDPKGHLLKMEFGLNHNGNFFFKSNFTAEPDRKDSPLKGLWK